MGTEQCAVVVISSRGGRLPRAGVGNSFNKKDIAVSSAVSLRRVGNKSISDVFFVKKWYLSGIRDILFHAFYGAEQVSNP